jgi:hypothetical protein
MNQEACCYSLMLIARSCHLGHYSILLYYCFFIHIAMQVATVYD